MRRLSSRSFVAAFIAVILLELAPAPSRPHARAGTESQPNIILFVTDDQRTDTLRVMPKVRKMLAGRGISFENGFVSNSLCCPSRASMLTGSYSHSNNVYQNFGPHGGVKMFSDESTVATWLDELGYRTGLVGKYFNGYKINKIPPGWDEWFAFMDKRQPGRYYYDYSLNENGKVKKYGNKVRDYSTDVLKRKALSFIKTSEKPFFLYFTPFAPHRHSLPAPRHRGALRNRKWVPTRSYNEKNVSDKPRWVKNLPRTGPSGTHQPALETLLAVDAAVNKMVRTLRRMGELRDTLFVFTSDNGVGWGEHRWMNKQDPYRGSMNVPFIIRYDRLIENPGVNTEDLVLNLDFAPTFVDVAGGTPPPVEGLSLKPLLESSPVEWREDFLIEHYRLGSPPSYCGIRTIDNLYVSYITGEEEFYDLKADPHELRNIVEEVCSTPTLTRFRERLRELCTPPPPGYVLPH